MSFITAPAGQANSRVPSVTSPQGTVVAAPQALKQRSRRTGAAAVVRPRPYCPSLDAVYVARMQGSERSETRKKMHDSALRPLKYRSAPTPYFMSGRRSRPRAHGTQSRRTWRTGAARRPRSCRAGSSGASRRPRPARGTCCPWCRSLGHSACPARPARRPWRRRGPCAAATRLTPRRPRWPARRGSPPPNEATAEQIPNKLVSVTYT